MNLVLEMNKGAAQAVKVCLSDFDNSQLVTQKQVAVPDYTNIASSLALQYLSNTGKVNLVHCSGRVASQIIRDIEDGSFSSLPFPVAAKTQTIIAGVGTEILDWNNH